MGVIVYWRKGHSAAD